jgi:hypothetical protein
MSPLTSVAPQDASSLMLVGSRKQEQLSYQSFDFQLSLADNRGREVSLSLNAEQLFYSRSYDKFGVIASKGGGGDALVDRLRSFVGDEAAEQFRSLAGDRGLLAVAEHESVELSASSLSIEVEGDLSLLQDYFNAPNTAQRIFDFASGLGAQLDHDSPDFGGFIDQIRQGIEEGFAMVEDLLGPLPEVSQQTHSLLQTMLDAFQADPTAEVPRAIDLYQQLIEDASQEA